MNGIEIYAQLLIGILGVAYPIIIQVISRLEDKYHTNTIIGLFTSEFEHIMFQRLLLFSAFTIVSYSISVLIHRLTNTFYAELMGNILIVATLFLLVSFIFEMLLLQKYSVTKAIVARLHKKYSSKTISPLLFTAASSILACNVVSSVDHDSLKKLYFIISEEFSKHSKSTDSESYLYYDTYTKLVNHLINSQDSALEYAADSIISGRLLLADVTSEGRFHRMLNYVWNGSLIAVLGSNRDDLFMMYWKYMDMIMLELSDSYLAIRESLEVIIDDTHESQVKSSVSWKAKKILEFNFAVGGLVLYQNKHEVIKRMFNHTTSQPPKHYLLPETLDEVMKWFVFFYDPWSEYARSITGTYNFPHTDGLATEGLVRKHVCSYIALLFLRLYTIRPTYFGQNILKCSVDILNQKTRRLWIESVGFLTTLIENWLSSKHELERVGLIDFNKLWLEENVKNPIDVIEELKSDLISSMERCVVELALSTTKITKFYKSTCDQYQSFIDSIASCTSLGQGHDLSEVLNLQGDYMLIEKTAFQDDVDIENINYDTILAGTLFDKLRRQLVSTCLDNPTEVYKSKPNLLFSMIDNLILDSKLHVILVAGMNLGYYISVLHIDGLSKTDYKGIPIIQTGVHNICGGIFVFERDNFPQVEFAEVTEDQIEKYNLIRLDTKYPLFASVLDFRENEMLRSDYLQEINQNKIKHPILVTISINMIIRRKNEFKLVQIKQIMGRNEENEQTSLGDVRPF